MALDLCPGPIQGKDTPEHAALIHMIVLNDLLDLLQLLLFGAPLVTDEVLHEVELGSGDIQFVKERLERGVAGLVSSNEIQTLRLAQLLELPLQIIADLLDVRRSLREVHCAHLILGAQACDVSREPAIKRDIPEVLGVSHGDDDFFGRHRNAFRDLHRDEDQPIGLARNER